MPNQKTVIGDRTRSLSDEFLTEMKEEVDKVMAEVPSTCWASRLKETIAACPSVVQSEQTSQWRDTSNVLTDEQIEDFKNEVDKLASETTINLDPHILDYVYDEGFENPTEANPYDKGTLDNHIWEMGASASEDNFNHTIEDIMKEASRFIANNK